MKRAVAYLRVSTDEQATVGFSVPAQRGSVEAYALAYGIQITRIFEDDRTAKNLDRPVLHEALSCLGVDGVEALLVVKLDRLTRSVVDLGWILDRYFGANQPWTLLSVQDSIDTRSPGGRLLLNILVSVAQWEREAISDRTRAVLNYKRDHGERIGSVPYGMTLAEDGIHLEVDPVEGAVVQTIRDLAQTGKGSRAIATELNRRGVPARGDRWHPTSVARILGR